MAYTNVATLPSRAFRIIDDTGEEGVTRSVLFSKLNTTAVDLDMALARLHAQGLIVWLKDVRGHRGRATTRYWAKAHEQVALTAAERPDIPVGDPDDPTPAGTCVQCGAATTMAPTGRGYAYCSDTCQAEYRTGGRRVAGLLAAAAAHHDYTYLWTATCLVMIDLFDRGFRVASPVFTSGTRLIVTEPRGPGLLWLDVLAISPDSGTFPDPNEYDSVALVYRDGRIVYAGRNPLVLPEPEAPEKGEHETDAAKV